MYFSLQLQVVSSEELREIKNDPTMSEEAKAQYISKQEDFVMRSQNVNKHAGLFVEFFKARVELFIEHVLKKCFGVVDYYIRYEYQVFCF